MCGLGARRSQKYAAEILCLWQCGKDPLLFCPQSVALKNGRCWSEFFARSLISLTPGSQVFYCKIFCVNCDVIEGYTTGAPLHLCSGLSSICVKLCSSYMSYILLLDMGNKAHFNYCIMMFSSLSSVICP